MLLLINGQQNLLRGKGHLRSFTYTNPQKPQLPSIAIPPSCPVRPTVKRRGFSVCAAGKGCADARRAEAPQRTQTSLACGTSAFAEQSEPPISTS